MIKETWENQIDFKSKLALTRLLDLYIHFGYLSMNLLIISS